MTRTSEDKRNLLQWSYYEFDLDRRWWHRGQHRMTEEWVATASLDKIREEIAANERRILRRDPLAGA